METGLFDLKFSFKKLCLILFFFIILFLLNIPLQSSGHIISDYEDYNNIIFAPKTEIIDQTSFTTHINQSQKSIQIAQINNSFLFDPIMLNLQLINATSNNFNNTQFYDPNLGIELFISYSTSDINLFNFVKTTNLELNQSTKSFLEIGNETHQIQQKAFSMTEFTIVFDPAETIPNIDQIETLITNSTQLDLIREKNLYPININIQLKLSYSLFFNPNLDITINSVIQRFENRRISSDLFHNKITGTLNSYPNMMHINSYLRDTKRRISVPIPRDLTSRYLNNTLRTHYDTSYTDNSEPKSLPIPKIKMQFSLRVFDLTHSSSMGESINLRFSYLSGNETKIIKPTSKTTIADYVYLFEYSMQYIPGLDHLLDFELFNLGGAVDVKIDSVVMIVSPLFYERQYTDLELIWIFIVTNKYMFIGLGTTIVVAKLVEDDDEDDVFDYAFIVVPEDYIREKGRNSLVIDDSKIKSSNQSNLDTDAPLVKEETEKSSVVTKDPAIVEEKIGPKVQSLDERVETAIDQFIARENELSDSIPKPPIDQPIHKPKFAPSLDSFFGPEIDEIQKTDFEYAPQKEAVNPTYQSDQIDQIDHRNIDPPTTKIDQSDINDSVSDSEIPEVDREVREFATREVENTSFEERGLDLNEFEPQDELETLDQDISEFEQTTQPDALSNDRYQDEYGSDFDEVVDRTSAPSRRNLDLSIYREEEDVFLDPKSNTDDPVGDAIQVAWELMMEGRSEDYVWSVTGVDREYLRGLLKNMMRINELENTLEYRKKLNRDLERLGNEAWLARLINRISKWKEREGAKSKFNSDGEKMLTRLRKGFVGRLRNLASKGKGALRKSKGVKNRNNRKNKNRRERSKTDASKTTEGSTGLLAHVSFSSFETLFKQDPKVVLVYVNKVIVKKEYVGLNIDLDLELRSLLEEETYVSGSFHRDLLFDIHGKPNDPKEVFELLARLIYYSKNDVIETKISKFELKGINKAYGFDFDQESFDSLEFYYDDHESWLKIDATDNGYNLNLKVKGQLRKLVDIKTGIVLKGKNRELKDLLFRLRANTLDEYFVTLESQLMKVLDHVHDVKLIKKLFGKDFVHGRTLPAQYNIKQGKKKGTGSIFGDLRITFHISGVMNRDFLGNKMLIQLLPDLAELENALLAIEDHKKLVIKYMELQGAKQSEIDALMINFEKQSLIIYEGRHGYDHLVTYRLPKIDDKGNWIDKKRRRGKIIFAPGETKSGVDYTRLDTRFIGKTNTAAAGSGLDEWTKFKKSADLLNLIAKKKTGITVDEVLEYAEEYYKRLSKSYRIIGLTGKVKHLTANILDGVNSPAGIIFKDFKGQIIVKPINMKTIHDIITYHETVELPDEILELDIPKLNNNQVIKTRDDFLEVFDPANKKFAMYPQKLFSVKNNYWTSNFEKYQSQFPFTEKGMEIQKSTIEALADAKSIPDNFKLDEMISYAVKVIVNGKEAIRNLKIRVLRVEIDRDDELTGKVNGTAALEFINRYEKYIELIEEQMRNEDEGAIVLLHLGKVNDNIYHDAAASLSRRLEPREASRGKSNEWKLEFSENGETHELIVKFPEEYIAMDNTLVSNVVNADAAGQKLLMILSDNLESDFYFYGAYRNGDKINDTPILNRLSMKYSNIQPRNTINTFWSARGENLLKTNQWFHSYRNDVVVHNQFFIKTNKGVKLDLEVLKSFIINLKSKYDILDNQLNDYFVDVFDLSAKTQETGEPDRTADLVQYFKKFVKSEGRDNALPAKYKTIENSKTIRFKDFLEMDIRNRSVNELMKDLEPWFKLNTTNKDRGRRFFPPGSDKSRTIPWKKGVLFDYAKPFQKLISSKNIEDIQNMSSRLTGEALKKFDRINEKIVNDVWIQLAPIFREIFAAIIGDKK